MLIMWQILDEPLTGIEHTVTDNDCPPPDGVHQLRPFNEDDPGGREILICEICKTAGRISTDGHTFIVLGKIQD